jgi:ABC-type nickel/cobalt efflux system permease component RcnA
MKCRVGAALTLLWAVAAVSTACRADTVASLLGNFTINQYCGLMLEKSSVAVHYTVVYGQLPALSELHAADADGNGVTSQGERDAYVGKLAPTFARGLVLEVDGAPVTVRPVRWTSSLPTEQGGFSLRVDVDYAAQLPVSAAGSRRLRFSNQNFAGRMGWHEITVAPAAGIAVFDTNAYRDSATGGLTEALSELPAAGPLDERSVHFSFLEGATPPAAVPLGGRPRSALPTLKPAAGGNGLGAAENAWIVSKTRDLIDAISAPTLEPRIVVWALIAALILGAVHALSPGHGKTIVGAYLIGSRGTPRHALFLGFTVTVTHTIGVFALGFATLYASRFIVPERLFPILSLVSAVLVLGMGVVLLVQRSLSAKRALHPERGDGLRDVVSDFVAIGPRTRASPLVLAPTHLHAHAHADGTMHSHGGGRMHSHLPPGAAGERISWRSLLTLGISGGLVPCPSAMVLLLAAVALNKTGYGMLLVLVFSVGLAITLTAVGLMFLYARTRFRTPHSSGRWRELLPVASAAVITLVGAFLCIGALRSFG